MCVSIQWITILHTINGARSSCGFSGALLSYYNYKTIKTINVDAKLSRLKVYFYGDLSQLTIIDKLEKYDKKLAEILQDKRAKKVVGDCPISIQSIFLYLWTRK